jgi:hypothetical protein
MFDNRKYAKCEKDILNPENLKTMMNPKTGYTLLMEYFNITYLNPNKGYSYENQFVEYARQNDCVNMQRMLMHGCDANFKAEDGETALSILVKNNNKNVTAQIINLFAELVDPDEL